MAFDNHKDLAYSLIASVTGSDGASLTQFSVTAGEGQYFPSAPFPATVGNPAVRPTPNSAEVLQVTARTIDAFTVQRRTGNQYIPNVISFVPGMFVSAGPVSKTFTELERYGRPFDIQYYTGYAKFGFQASMPADAQFIDLYVAGAGGAGGGGCKGPDGQVRGGGGGGSSGVTFRRSFIKVATSTYYGNISNGGLPGAAATANNTDGTAGGAGGQSLIGSQSVGGAFIVAYPGNGGQGGIVNNTGGSGGVVPINTALSTTGGNGGGAISPNGFTVANVGNSGVSGGGGGGGGISSANVVGTGAPGSGIAFGNANLIQTGQTPDVGWGTAGGNGGNASRSGNAFSGDAVNSACAGGGGGGAGLNSVGNGGQGGHGGPGQAVFIIHY